MILPPFFGISSKYNEDIVKQIIIDYLSQDHLTYRIPSTSIGVTYIQIDSVTYAIVDPQVNSTYLQLDSLHLPSLNKATSATYLGTDILCYRPPPSLPEITFFIFVLEEDSQIELQWSTPYNNRCNIVNYLIQFSQITDTLSIITENSDRLLSEIESNIKLEPNIETYNWQDLNFNSNFAVISNLINDTGYIFRVGAVNCVGLGPLGYTDKLFPVSIKHTYCNIVLFLSPNSSTDISAALVDNSCYPKQSFDITGVSTSNQSKFGAGSIYFNGQINTSVNPTTYSHIKTLSLDSSWSLIGDFTIETWVKPDIPNSVANQTIISSYTQQKNNITSNQHFWKLYFNNNGIYFRLGTNDSSYIELSATNLLLSSDNFTHISVSKLNNYIRLYINGQRYDRRYFNNNIIIQDNLLIIGANQTRSYLLSDISNIGRGAVNEPYIGYMDDIMISNEARYAKDFVPIEYIENKDCELCKPDAPTNLQVFYIAD